MAEMTGFALTTHKKKGAAYKKKPLPPEIINADNYIRKFPSTKKNRNKRNPSIIFQHS